MKTKTYPTNYKAAVRWLNGNLILCNEIAEFQEEFWYKGFVDDELETEEIYQWYLTNYSDDDVDWLIDHFGLKFAYYEKLDLWILCVTHYGTSWDYVYWETDIEQASCGLGEVPRPF